MTCLLFAGESVVLTSNDFPAFMKPFHKSLSPRTFCSNSLAERQQGQTYTFLMLDHLFMHNIDLNAKFSWSLGWKEPAESFSMCV